MTRGAVVGAIAGAIVVWSIAAFVHACDPEPSPGPAALSITARGPSPLTVIVGELVEVECGGADAILLYHGDQLVEECPGRVLYGDACHVDGARVSLDFAALRPGLYRAMSIRAPRGLEMSGLGPEVDASDLRARGGSAALVSVRAVAP